MVALVCLAVASCIEPAAFAYLAGNYLRRRHQCNADELMSPPRAVHVHAAGLHYGEVFEQVALLQCRPDVPPDMPPDYAG